MLKWQMKYMAMVFLSRSQSMILEIRKRRYYTEWFVQSVVASEISGKCAIGAGYRMAQKLFVCGVAATAQLIFRIKISSYRILKSHILSITCL